MISRLLVPIEWTMRLRDSDHPRLKTKKNRLKTTSLKLACWNIRSMQDFDEADQS